MPKKYARRPKRPRYNRSGVSSPYSNFSNETMSILAFAIDILRHYAPRELSQYIDWEKLAIESPVLYTEKADPCYADLIFSAPGRTPFGQFLFKLLAEHKLDEYNGIMMQAANYMFNVLFNE